MSVNIVEKAAKELYPLITEEFSAQSTKKYNNDTWTLEQLDQWTTADLPQLLEKRHAQAKLNLTKAELVLLMDWKLAKGKFRPSLPKLIKSNEDETVAQVSEEGLGEFMSYISKAAPKKWSEIVIEDYTAATKAALKSLCRLRGVGPATASLMLSLLSHVTPYAPPFFSDESFMYFIRDALRPSQPIKYNVKEYIDEYVVVLVGVAAKNNVPLTVLEKGAWSLKMYHNFRIDRLADIKLPFSLEDSELDHFEKTSDYLNAKRPAPKEQSKSKRAKTETK